MSESPQKDDAMRVAVVTLFPEMFDALRLYGISSRAISHELLHLKCFNPRAYTLDRHQTVDARPYGGGPGMVMQVEPLQKAVAAGLDWINSDHKSEKCHPPKVIYLSPQGKKLSQADVKSLAHGPDLVLVAGRYEGVDERFIESCVDEEWSIGDYVLSGGEIPAMVMLDAMVRLIPGALGDADSAQQDSFEQGWLDCPHYTRPEVFQGRSVPDVLLSGDHKKIEQWRLKQALGRTWLRRPDLLETSLLNASCEALLEGFKQEFESKLK